jgi:hypothetical protein
MVAFGSNDGAGDSVVCRIGTASDLSSYLAESDTVSITTTSKHDKLVPFGTCLNLTDSTVYYVGCTETGTVYMYKSDTNQCGSDADDARYAASSGWNMVTSDTTEDVDWTLVLDD